MEQIICYTAYCTLVIISNGNVKKRATNAKCFLAPFFTTRTQCKFALKFIRLSFQRYRFSFGKKCSNFHYILFFIIFLQYVQACGVTGEKEHIFDNQKKLNHFQKKRVWCNVDEFFSDMHTVSRVMGLIEASCVTIHLRTHSHAITFDTLAQSICFSIVFVIHVKRFRIGDFLPILYFSRCTKRFK